MSGKMHKINTGTSEKISVISTRPKDWSLYSFGMVDWGTVGTKLGNREEVAPYASQVINIYYVRNDF